MTLSWRRSSSPGVVDSTRQWCTSTARDCAVSKEHSKQQNLHRAAWHLVCSFLPLERGEKHVRLGILGIHRNRGRPGIDARGGAVLNGVFVQIGCDSHYAGGRTSWNGSREIHMRQQKPGL